MEAISEPHEIRMIMHGQYEEAYELLEDAVAVGLTPILIGPPGVGKSLLARKFASDSNRPFYEIFFDELIRPGYLVGSFDPSLVLQAGFSQEAFDAGPLMLAMKEGGVFLAQEINRASEYCQNSLLEPMEERSYYIPRIGRVYAHEDFMIIGTANPAELAGTHRISEALRDRFRVWIPLDYPDMVTELKIIALHCEQSLLDESVLNKIYAIIRAMRESPDVEIQASIRAGISIAKLAFRHKSKGRELDDEALADYATKVLLGSSQGSEWSATRREIGDIAKGALTACG